MKVLITGATGFVGQKLVQALLEHGDSVIAVSRSIPAVPGTGLTGRVRHVSWNPQDNKTVIREVDGVDAVINLAGESIVQRWTEKRKRTISKSRIDATKIVYQSIRAATVKPKILINASAVGYYGSRSNEALSEETGPGTGFLADTCKQWEDSAVRVEEFNVRVVRLRIGIVLDRDGGALQLMLPPFKLGFGGWLGSGNQWMSWIHRADLVRLILFCLDHGGVKGAVNAASPLPVTNKTFSMVLAQVLKRPCLLPVPVFALKLIMGEVSEMLLTGQRIVPKKAQDYGFSYEFPDIRKALEEILIEHR